jgi:hypothetical protein
MRRTPDFKGNSRDRMRTALAITASDEELNALATGRGRLAEQSLFVVKRMEQTTRLVLAEDLKRDGIKNFSNNSLPTNTKLLLDKIGIHVCDFGATAPTDAQVAYGSYVPIYNATTGAIQAGFSTATLQVKIGNTTVIDDLPLSKFATRASDKNEEPGMVRLDNPRLIHHNETISVEIKFAPAMPANNVFIKLTLDGTGFNPS